MDLLSDALQIKRVKKERREAPGSPSSSAAEDEGEDESGNAANVEDDDFLADSEEEVDMDELIGSDDPLAVWEVIQNRKKGAYNNVGLKLTMNHAMQY